MMRTRARVLVSAVAALLLAAAPRGNAQDHQHDFDFEFGAWTVQLRRLVHPLTGSGTWVEYTGTSVVRPLWGGRANVGELDVTGVVTRAHLDGLSLRLYNPQSGKWRLYFSNAADGSLGVPTVGRFENGRGEFFDRERLDGRPIVVRFVFSGITVHSFRFEQSFSADDGRTWEANWIARFTRATAASVSRRGPRRSAGRPAPDLRPVPVDDADAVQRNRMDDAAVVLEVEGGRRVGIPRDRRQREDAFAAEHAIVVPDRERTAAEFGVPPDPVEQLLERLHGIYTEASDPCSMRVPSTARNCASHFGCAGHAGAVTRFPSVTASSTAIDA